MQKSKSSSDSLLFTIAEKLLFDFGKTDLALDKFNLLVDDYKTSRYHMQSMYILSKYLPEEYFNRPKAGFAIPVSDWMKKDLKDWVNDILSSEICNKHNYFNYNIIQKLKNEHFAGTSNHEHKLWSLIQFNIWYQKNISR